MKDKKRRILRLIFTVLSILTVGWIFYNSAQNADRSSSMSGAVREFINQLFRSVGLPFYLDSFLVRKLAHFTEFAVLGALLSITAYLYIPQKRKAFLIALPAGLAVAVCDELLQMTSEGRSPQITDVLIDFSGVLTAALIFLFVVFLRQRHKAKKEGNGIE